MVKEFSVGQWIGIVILLNIPLVNIIFILYGLFAFQDKNLRNLCKAYIFMLIVAVLIGVFIGIASS